LRKKKIGGIFMFNQSIEKEIDCCIMRGRLEKRPGPSPRSKPEFSFIPDITGYMGELSLKIREKQETLEMLKFQIETQQFSRFNIRSKKYVFPKSVRVLKIKKGSRIYVACVEADDEAYCLQQLEKYPICSLEVTLIEILSD